MPLGLGLLPVQGVLAAGTALGLDGDDAIDLFDRHQCPRLLRMSRLPAGPTPTAVRGGRLLKACGGSLDGGRDEVRESCCRRSINVG